VTDLDKTLFSLQQLEEIYKHTAAGSPLRKLVVDYTLDQLCSSFFKEYVDE